MVWFCCADVPTAVLEDHARVSAVPVTTPGVDLVTARTVIALIVALHDVPEMVSVSVPVDGAASATALSHDGQVSVAAPSETVMSPPDDGDAVISI